MKLLPLRPIPRFRNATDCAAFTLVEMLVVISIMLALMGLVAAALTGVGKAHSLVNAGNQIATMATIARQNSMTKNALTAMVIPTGKNGWNACILYELTSEANDGSAAANWRPISKWTALPAGIAIDSCEFVAESAPKNFPDLSSILPARDEPVTTYRYIVFTPTGALYPFPTTNVGGQNQAAANPGVRLVEGMRIGENANDVEYTGTTKGDQASFYRVTILHATGVPKIDRL